MEESSPAWTWQDALLFLGAYLPALLIGAFLSQLVPAGTGGVAGRLLFAQLVTYAFSVAVIAFLVRLRSDNPARDALGLRLRLSMLPPAILGGPLLAIAVNVVAVLLKAPQIDSQVKEWLADPRSLPLVALFIVVLAPAVEELVFRGFLQPLATRTAGVVGGVLLVALAFALLHGPTYHWAWQQLTVMLLAGCAFGAMRQFTGSTTAAALLHASYNATMLYAYLV